ncbi:S8 family peptidase [Clostridium paraputrificum]|uniref:S8 family peptidase n=1 Tax=Clostridium paraputrificum TaxID=29363 RepID=UPI0018983BFD|nr:S8 family peptidase [Clostridium paraputrificum]MDC0801515.1 S8 family peptidase [Clostridium paraputrificum]
MGNNMPIKFFAKREVDNSRTEGGGGKDPSWILEGEELISHSNELNNSLKVIEEIFNKRKEEENFIPVVIKAKINSAAKAKSHRSEVGGIFKVASQESIIGLLGEDELLIKISSKQALNRVENRIKDYNKNAYGISCIDNIEALYPITSTLNEDTTYKVKLINYHEYDIDRLVSVNFEKKCKSLGVELNKTIYADELSIYSVKNVGLDTIRLIEEYPAILSIEPMPKYLVDLDFFSLGEASFVKSPQEGQNYVTVGVLDSGISKIESIKPWLRGERQTFYPENLIDPSHGTFVAGVILYGDELEDREYTGLLGCKILDGNVFPDLTKESIEEDELIYNIREIVKSNYKEVKIWNLSGGLQVEIDEDKFSDFAIALDDISDTYGVIICKSAGNCSNFMKGKPKGRIVKSADSVRSIVVGSIAQESNKESGIKKEFPSPFTRVGRGPASIVKPDVVHYGGNAGVDDFGNVKINGVKSFDANGNVTSHIGTSFSTPRVSAILAGLQNEIAEEFDPLLLKTLLIHSANYGEGVDLSPSEKLNQMGFGKPKAVREILYNNPNEITLILRDTIRKGQFIEILDFPFPEGLKNDDSYRGQVTVTLAYDSILEPTQGSEYCQSNVDIYFGSYDEKTLRDISKNNILNPIGKDNPKNLLLHSNYSKTAIKSSTEGFGLTERMLIDYGDKFYPVKKYAVDLTEMTPSNKTKYLTGNKRWFLKIEGLYRDFIEKKALQESLELSQEICVIITIKDPEKKCNVYDEVTQLLDINNFWHNNIKLHQAINIRVDE